jgi:hypothetical protein
MRGSGVLLMLGVAWTGCDFPRHEFIDDDLFYGAGARGGSAGASSGGLEAGGATAGGSSGSDPGGSGGASLGGAGAGGVGTGGAGAGGVGTGGAGTGGAGTGGDGAGGASAGGVGGASSGGGVGSGGTTGSAPAPPEDVQGCSTCGDCDASPWPVSWSAVADATHYNVIFRCSIFETVKDVGNVTNADLCGPPVGMCNAQCGWGVGYVGVQACNAAGCSAATQVPAEGVPAACGGGVCC